MDDATIGLLARWRSGDQQAADELFRLYVERLTALARRWLSAKLARRVDPEDVVQSAYRSFFAAARERAYDLKHGGDLWRLLLSITMHKLKNQVKRHTAGKRTVESEQAFGSEDSLLGLQANVLAREPSPVEAAAMVDQLEHIMRELEPLQRRMLELRLQGHSLYEIAAQTRRSVPTVRRVLDRFKSQWKQKQADASAL